jgi:hypothetical protein
MLMMDSIEEKLKHCVTRGTFNTNEQMQTNAEKDSFAQSTNIELDTALGLDEVTVYQRKVTEEA